MKKRKKKRFDFPPFGGETDLRSKLRKSSCEDDESHHILLPFGEIAQRSVARRAP